MFKCKCGVCYDVAVQDGVAVINEAPRDNIVVGGKQFAVVQDGKRLVRVENGVGVYE
jgi:hypothetical protein